MINKFSRSTNRFLSFVVTAAFIAVATGTAVASTAQTDPTPVGTPTAEQTELSMEQVIAKLKEQGYTDITEIELEGDRYCVDARDAEGKKADLYVDAKTGKITKEDKED